MSDLYILIPAAGESLRFKELGYSTPKPFLKIQDSTGLTLSMLTHVISNLPPNMDIEKIIVGIPPGYEPCSYGEFRIINKTVGQADTILQLLEGIPNKSRILVLDCDMILDPKDILQMLNILEVYDVVVAVAETFDPNASRVDNAPLFSICVEKEPISQYGIVSARLFKNAGLLSDALKNRVKHCELDNTEPYLSEAINLYFSPMKWAHLIYQYEDWGTPQRILESGAKIVYENNPST